jgi:ABC-type molybdate transport system substrate-binding protein
VGGIAGVIGSVQLGHAETLTVAAGHSLKVPFQEILPIFEQEYGVRLADGRCRGGILQRPRVNTRGEVVLF